MQIESVKTFSLLQSHFVKNTAQLSYGGSVSIIMTNILHIHFSTFNFSEESLDGELDISHMWLIFLFWDLTFMEIQLVLMVDQF